jgi:hypothetical protein
VIASIPEWDRVVAAATHGRGGTSTPLTRNKNSSSSQRYFRCLSDIPWTLALFVFPLAVGPRAPKERL